MVTSLYFFGAMHIGFGFVGLCVTYLAGSVAYYGGESGFLVNTPLAPFVASDYQALSIDNPLDFVGIFDFIKALGDLVKQLLFFDYEIVTSLTSADGAMFWIGQLFRLVSVAGTIVLGYHIYRLITSSGLMQSNWGAAVVLGGVGITGALGAIGFIFD